jgi:hypothetical protein
MDLTEHRNTPGRSPQNAILLSAAATTPLSVCHAFNGSRAAANAGER